ncbi:hypothetical protein N0V90_009671 [Kalmusia sp. IMI 367209]|nr:hypothetical protein N0V90_009671 [Kalmusia sp. IMI 367209]
MIHSSLDYATAYDGLILTMVCIGAVYSDRIGVRDVRWLMELVRASVFRSSQVYKGAMKRARDAVEESTTLSGNIQEIQALVHIQSLFVWHGSQKQRQQAREEFWVLASIVRQAGMLRPFPSGHVNASTLHQPGPLNVSELNFWTWPVWLEQETRIRVLYLVFLIDASLAIFFNLSPQFDTFDIQLPLPADDAAWEAKTGEKCASALGLRGEVAQEQNYAGSRRPKQLVMSDALALLHQGTNFPHRATNVYSKFILIHAIHVQIYKLQRQFLSSSISSFSSSNASTPQSHSDWTSTDGTISNGSSGHVTPVDGNVSQNSQAQLVFRSTMFALMLWKKNWDSDMQSQYGTSQRPQGFCRDGIHFYFLAKAFLQNSRREDWGAQPDVRFQQVFNLLKHIRTHVASDSASKNLDTGSVTSVDDSYGMADLTLNMKLLFTPILDTTPPF